jgi:hypothetical protein
VAIGLRKPTPSPDVTVQLSDNDGGVAVYALRHFGLSLVEQMFQFSSNP